MTGILWDRHRGREGSELLCRVAMRVLTVVAVIGGGLLVILVFGGLAIWEAVKLVG